MPPEYDARIDPEMKVDQRWERMTGATGHIGSQVPGNFAGTMPPGTDLVERRYSLEFTAKTGEYFRIWIVNLVLTILTLGIYSAWAKVRKRRYFYGHTKIDGDSFEYRGQPIAILKGRLIAVGFAAVFSLSARFYPGSQFIFLGLLLFLAPWLIVRSLAFGAYNSAYRNIRLHFRGTYLRCLKVLLLYGLVTIVTLGLGYAYLKARMIEFVANHHYYGRTQFEAPDLRPAFWKAYRKVIAWGFLAGLILGVGSFALGSNRAAVLQSPWYTLVIYIGYLYLFAFLRARLANETWNAVSAGPLRFECTMTPWEVFKLYLVNMLAIIFSVGLAVPWAVVRTLRYRARNFAVIATGGLDGFVGAESAQVSAAGEEVGEMFEIDIGL